MLGPAPAPREAPPQLLEGDIGAPLDPRFTFDHFVVGTSNELAYAAAKRVAGLERRRSTRCSSMAASASARPI